MGVNCFQEFLDAHCYWWRLRGHRSPDISHCHSSSLPSQAAVLGVPDLVTVEEGLRVRGCSDGDGDRGHGGDSQLLSQVPEVTSFPVLWVVSTLFMDVCMSPSFCSSI